jgi:hypothetical protein
MTLPAFSFQPKGGWIAMTKIIWHCLEALAATRRRVNRRRQKACLVWLTNQVFGAGCGKQASKSLPPYLARVRTYF